MNVYLVGESIDGKDRYELFDPNTNFNDFFNINNSLPARKKVQVYTSYHAARTAALAEDQTKPIFTLALKNNPLTQSLPESLSISRSQVEVISASLVHKYLGIYYIKKDANPHFEKQQELNRLFEERMLLSDNIQAPSALVETPIRDQAPILPSTELATQNTPSFFSLPNLMSKIKWVGTGINATVASSVGFGFWYFASSAVAAQLPHTNLNPAQDAFFKELGLSLLTTVGSFLALKIKAVKNLEKLLIVKSLSKAARFLMERKLPKAPAVPNVYLSAEHEKEFKDSLLGAELAKITSSFVEVGISMSVDSAFGDKPSVLRFSDLELDNLDNVSQERDVMEDEIQDEISLSEATEEHSTHRYNLRKTSARQMSS